MQETTVGDHTSAGKPRTPFSKQDPVHREDPLSGDEDDPLFEIELFNPSDQPIAWINRIHDLIKAEGINSLRGASRCL